MTKVDSKPSGSARERLLEAAYRLFAAQGVGSVGVDTIVAESGCAKSSLYKNFQSKQELALAFLDRRELVWTRNWLEAEVRRRTEDPEERLLAIFDIFDGWFRTADFEGCSFINVLLESEPLSSVRKASADHLAKIRAIVCEFAEQAGLADAEQFAHAWHMLMKGSIVAAGEGNREAARHAKRAAQLLLAGWERRARG